jgi:HTH-type transcriptional regulator/antitoxin HipB
VEQILSNSQQVGLLLQSARKHKGYSQAYVAARAGISQSRLSKLETNTAAMSLDMLLSMSAQLGLELTLREKSPGANLSVVSADSVAPGDSLPPSEPEW